jgi:peptidoglycan hydrolase-like protein with peptidoglycan-binding domain
METTPQAFRESTGSENQLVSGYRQSSIDGYYGANTHQDVRSFQAFKSLPVDGLVGSNTWTAYRNQLTFTGVNGAFDLYKTAGNGSNWFAKDVVEIGHKWYTGNVANINWVQFGTSGPN